MGTIMEILAGLQAFTSLATLINALIAAQKAGTDPTVAISTFIENELQAAGIVTTGGAATTVAELEAAMVPITGVVQAAEAIIKLFTPVVTPTPAPNPAPAA